MDLNLFILDAALCAVSDLSDFVRHFETAKSDPHYIELYRSALSRAQNYVSRLDSYVKEFESENSVFKQ